MANLPTSPDVNLAPGYAAGNATYIGFAAGLYYRSPSYNGQSLALAQNQLSAFPMVVPEAVTFDRIGVNVTVLGAASVVRIGIYTDNHGKPANLVLDAGTIDSSTTGAKEITISQALAPGIYWLAVVSPTITPPSIAAYSTATGVQVGAAVNTQVTGHGRHISGTSTPGALPAAFGTVAGTAVEAPGVFVRAA